MCLYLKNKWGREEEKEPQQRLRWASQENQTKAGSQTTKERSWTGNDLQGQWHWDLVRSHQMLQWMRRCAAKSSQDQSTHSPSCWEGWLWWPSAKSFPTNDLLLKRAPHPRLSFLSRHCSHTITDPRGGQEGSDPCLTALLCRGTGSGGPRGNPWDPCWNCRSVTLPLLPDPLPALPHRCYLWERSQEKIPSHSLFPRNLTQDRCGADS